MAQRWPIFTWLLKLVHIAAASPSARCSTPAVLSMLVLTTLPCSVCAARMVSGAADRLW